MSDDALSPQKSSDSDHLSKPNYTFATIEENPSKLTDQSKKGPFSPKQRRRTHFILDGITKSWASTPIMAPPVNQNHSAESKKTILPPKQPEYLPEGINVDAEKNIHPYFKGYFSPEFYGSYQEAMIAFTKPISSYSLIFEHPSVHKPFERMEKKRSLQPVERKLQKPKPRAVPKKVAWKLETKRFPNNVKSLIATGMLDGVVVRYVSSSGEKLRGIIKDSGYLCGCDSCNYSKTLNAYEFERHAGCKTSHPNNHIRFENGKTIHEIVQDLKNTGDDMLCDAIQTVTGSPINQSAFLIWKDSFEAATRKNSSGASWGGSDYIRS